MKIIVTADWHVKMWNDRDAAKPEDLHPELVEVFGSEFGNTLPKRLVEIYETIRQMCSYARANNIPRIVVAGDINDTKNVVNVIAFVMLKRLLESYPDIDFLMVHGNHDSTARIDKTSAIELLQNETNIRCVITEPHIEEHIVCVPFGRTMPEIINDLEPRNLLISHFGLNEASLSNGLSIRSSIGLRDVRKFGMTILGHYHKPQELDNVWYCGSPIQMRRDESGEVKRFLVVDTETLEVESIPTEGYRRYHELVIDSKDNYKQVIKQYEELTARGDFTHVRKTCPDKVQLPEDLVVLDDFEEEYQLRGITSGMNLADQMKKWLEIQEVPTEEWDEYMHVGLTAIERGAD